MGFKRSFVSESTYTYSYTSVKEEFTETRTWHLSYIIKNPQRKVGISLFLL